MNKIAIILLLAGILAGCAAPKTMVATGGSRSDGVVKMSYEFTAFEAPVVDKAKALETAKQRCAVWGYTDAEPFGMNVKSCSNVSFGGCNAWMATTQYQCIGNPVSK